MSNDFFFKQDEKAEKVTVDSQSQQETVSEIDLPLFLVAQVHAMDKAVYIESQKVKRNLRCDEQGHQSKSFFFKWISKHAPAFNKAWSTSLCKDCSKVSWCYDCCKEKCENFKNKIGE